MWQEVFLFSAREFAHILLSGNQVKLFSGADIWGLIFTKLSHQSVKYLNLYWIVYFWTITYVWITITASLEPNSKDNALIWINHFYYNMPPLTLDLISRCKVTNQIVNFPIIVLSHHLPQPITYSFCKYLISSSYERTSTFKNQTHHELK